MYTPALLLLVGLIGGCRPRGEAVTAAHLPEIAKAAGAGEFQIMRAATRPDGGFDLSYCDEQFWPPGSHVDAVNARLRKECEEKCWGPVIRLQDIRRRHETCVLDEDCAATAFLPINKSGIKEALESEEPIKRSGCPSPRPTPSSILKLTCYRRRCVDDTVRGR